MHLRHFLVAAALAVPALFTSCAGGGFGAHRVVEAGPQYPGLAAWCVADTLDGKVVLAHNADQRRPVASLTKIATCVVTLDFLRQSRTDAGELMTVPMSAAALGTPSAVGLQPGDNISIRDALYAAMMASDNWAAETIAQHVGGRLSQAIGGAPGQAFVKQMNGLCATLGLKDTHFTNAHGLEIGGQQPYSTAADLTRLSIFAQRQAGFTFYTGQKSRAISWSRAGAPQRFTVQNTNSLLGRGNIDGIKTGTTAAAGPCLIISADKPSTVQKNADGSTSVTPNRLVVVALGAAQDRFSQAWQLLQDGWGQYDGWRAAGSPLQSTAELLRPTSQNVAPARAPAPAAAPAPAPPEAGAFGAPGY